MDIGDIIKDYFWVILAVLFYLLAGRKKKKPQTEEDPTVKISTPPAPAKAGLQERLEQALREMQERAERESGNAPAQATAPSAPRQPAAISTPAPAPTLSLEEGVPFETAADRNAFTFTSAVPLHQRKTALDMVLEAEQKIETEKPERFTGFREGHGLRYHTHAEEMATARTAEFHEAHGLHYGQGSARSGTSIIREEEPSSLFKTEEELRRAIITAEILGPPKGRR